jgi:predicted nucleic acid-binding Zn ribbon protein
VSPDEQPEHRDQPGRPEQPEQADQTGDRPERSEGPAQPPASHDESGLDLARSVARGLAGAKRVPRRGRPGAGAPGSAGRRFARRQDPQASGAHPDDRDPQLLDSTIGRLISEQGWATDVRVHGVFTRWEHLVGPEVAQHCRPESYKEGRLTVRTDSTAWATQMKLLAPTVLRRLNGELGDGTVTFIDVLGPHLPSWRKGPRSVRDGRGPRDTYG